MTNKTQQFIEVFAKGNDVQVQEHYFNALHAVQNKRQDENTRRILLATKYVLRKRDLI